MQQYTGSSKLNHHETFLGNPVYLQNFTNSDNPYNNLV